MKNLKGKNKRLFAGYYKKYDNSLIYVVTVVTDVDTGIQSVIFHEGVEAYNAKFKSMTKESFCEMVEVDGELVDKFTRKTDLKVKELHDLNIMDAGFNPPIRKPEKVSDEAYYERDFRCSKDYISYAKDLMENYKTDVRRYKLCKEHGRLVGINNKKDLNAMKEDITFLRVCFKTVLLQYQSFFKERYMENKSIRKYAEEHELNRGSVVYMNKKMVDAFADELRKRDESDGVCRLKI